MLTTIRQQLTLFVSDQKEVIEQIRAKFNPIQYGLIAAHVTLCREDELVPIEKIIHNLKAIQLEQPMRIMFDAVERFSEGKGVMIPARKNNISFHELRKSVLKGVIESPREQLPHITLMHPRNSSCTDSIFNTINEYQLPEVLYFDAVSFIEQKDGEKWITLEEFPIIKGAKKNDQHE